MAAIDFTRSGESHRTQRADARRNRERILAAAGEVFAEAGFDVGVATIAKRAGVGTGTLFRHFPTKTELELAVVLERSSGVRDLVDAALTEPDPWAAFEQLMTSMVEMTACDRCLGGAARPELLSDPRVQELRVELVERLEKVISRARDAGVLRSEVAAEDIPVLAMAIGSTMTRFGRSNPELWRRYLGVVLNGLRTSGSLPLQPGPPSPADLDAGCVAPVG